MAMLEGDAEKIFIKAAEKSAAGSDWEKLFSGLADLAADVTGVMGEVAGVRGELLKLRRQT